MVDDCDVNAVVLVLAVGGCQVEVRERSRLMKLVDGW
jgi:hypothetical protein